MPTSPPAPAARHSDLPPLLRHLALAGVWSLPIGLAVGTACAIFLWSLDRVTALRWQAPWLLYLLPLAGVGVGLLYHKLGQPPAGRHVDAGNNLILDEIHAPAGGAGVPGRIVPLVLVGTLMTHLFGGSAGREGTAVQMGGGIASILARQFRGLAPATTRTLLLCGVAAGFGGVFGTPLAATIFAMEVLAIGRISYEAILPCLFSALLADWTCAAWGVHHTSYPIAPLDAALTGVDTASHWWLLGKVALVGAASGLAARLFSGLAHAAQQAMRDWIRVPYLRPAVGGVGVILLAALFGQDYLGIGVTHPDPGVVSIVSAFRAGGAMPWSWLLKLVFTVVTLASGFKGGEVTPLFFIGATLGNTLAVWLHAPIDLFAGLGFVAVFAAAANTPLASTLMALELFGAGSGAQVLYVATACFIAYAFSGQAGIYRAQRVAIPKPGRTDDKA